MVGDQCLVGLTAEEARNVLDTANGRIEVVVQRKESPRQTLIANTTTPMTAMRSLSKLAMRSHSSCTTSMAKKTHSNSVDGASMLHLGMDRNCSRGSGIDLSQRRMNPQYSLEEIQEYLAKQEEVASFLP